MFKLFAVMGIIGLLAACSTTSDTAYRSRSADSSNTATMGAPRSPGEGPSFNPYYGGAGF